MRHTPVPLAAIALLLGLWVATSQSGSVPKAMCDADLKDLINEIEANRTAALKEINRQLDDAGPGQRPSLLAMREQAWDDEEQQRATATVIWQDCMRAAKGG